MGIDVYNADGSRRVSSTGSNLIYYDQITASAAKTNGTYLFSGASTTYEARPIRVEFYAQRVTAGGNMQAHFYSIVDSVASALLVSRQVAVEGTLNVGLFGVHRFTPSAGAHTIGIYVTTNDYGGSGVTTVTVQAGTGTAGASAPSYIRISYDD